MVLRRRRSFRVCFVEGEVVGLFVRDRRRGFVMSSERCSRNAYANADARCSLGFFLCSEKWMCSGFFGEMKEDERKKEKREEKGDI